MTKYNWLKLRANFVSGDCLTVVEFFRAHNVPSNSRTRLNAKGWREERLEYQKKIIAQTQERTVESEAEIRLRQQREALLLQSKGLQRLKELPVERLDDARKLLVDGLQQEREALGLGSERSERLQVAVDLLPHTDFDRMFKNLNYEQTLELIAGVKKEKERRESLKLSLTSGEEVTKE